MKKINYFATATKKGQAAGGAYNGPWQVIKDPESDNKVIIKAYDGDKYWAFNLIQLPIAYLHIDTDLTVTCTTTGVVYLHLYYEDNEYKYEGGNATDLPDQANGHAYMQLAAVSVSSGKVTVKAQIQRGNITISSRVA